jgi:hypothetical protein
MKIFTKCPNCLNNWDQKIFVYNDIVGGYSCSMCKFSYYTCATSFGKLSLTRFNFPHEDTNLVFLLDEQHNIIKCNLQLWHGFGMREIALSVMPNVSKEQILKYIAFL